MNQVVRWEWGGDEKRLSYSREDDSAVLLVASVIARSLLMLFMDFSGLLSGVVAALR
jgi:hypothetical protein